jgi:hypothetical protein
MYFKNKFITPVNFNVGSGSVVGGSQLNYHSSSNIPVTLLRNEKTNRILSPGLITFYSW